MVITVLSDPFIHMPAAIPAEAAVPPVAAQVPTPPAISAIPLPSAGAWASLLL